MRNPNAVPTAVVPQEVVTLLTTKSSEPKPIGDK